MYSNCPIVAYLFWSADERAPVHSSVVSSKYSWFESVAGILWCTGDRAPALVPRRWRPVIQPFHGHLAPASPQGHHPGIHGLCRGVSDPDPFLADLQLVGSRGSWLLPLATCSRQYLKDTTMASSERYFYKNQYILWLDVSCCYDSSLLVKIAEMSLKINNSKQYIFFHQILFWQEF